MAASVTTTLIAIGGGLDLNRPSPPLMEFYRRSGGEHGTVVIIPTASTLAHAGSEISAALLRLGLKRPPLILPLRDRATANYSDNCTAVQNASGIFFTGGNQLRLTAILGGTALEHALQAVCQRGAILAGTSAGAAALSQVMLAYGKNGKTPRTGMAQFTPGLGFTRRVIFDQHFRQRDRIGRLIYAVANHPGLLGVGIDENTAAILIESKSDDIHEAANLHVVGKNAVTILDGRSIQASDVADLENNRPLAASNLVLHILTDGCEFDLLARQATIPEKILSVE